MRLSVQVGYAGPARGQARKHDGSIGERRRCGDIDQVVTCLGHFLPKAGSNSGLPRLQWPQHLQLRVARRASPCPGPKATTNLLERLRDLVLGKDGNAHSDVCSYFKEVESCFKLLARTHTTLDHTDRCDSLLATAAGRRTCRTPIHGHARCWCLYRWLDVLQFHRVVLICLVAFNYSPAASWLQPHPCRVNL